jgi:hypothetical protein
MAAAALAGACLAALAGVVLAQEADAPAEFKNVKVLTTVKTKQEMRQIMKAQAASLGVKCGYCHVPGKFHLDDKEEKQVARKMLEMVKDLNTRVFTDPDGPKVSCWTCHRGKDEPETQIPAEVLAAADEFEAK